MTVPESNNHPIANLGAALHSSSSLPSTVESTPALHSSIHPLEAAVYALSDFVFVYGHQAEKFVGEYCLQWAEEGKKNAFGRVVKVLKLTTNAGSAAMLESINTARFSVSVLVSSFALHSLVSVLARLKRARKSVTVHVATFGETQLSELRASRASSIRENALPGGVKQFSSGTAQQAVRGIAEAFQWSVLEQVPVVHYFDGGLLYEASTVETQFGFAASKSNNVGDHAKLISGSVAVPEFFKYYGSNNATVLYVAHALEAEPFVANPKNVSHLEAHDIGLVVVKVCRPWPVEQFLDVLPSSSTLKKIFVIDESKSSTLLLDVAAAIRCGLSRYSNELDIECVKERLSDVIQINSQNDYVQFAFIVKNSDAVSAVVEKLSMLMQGAKLDSDVCYASLDGFYKLVLFRFGNSQNLLASPQELDLTKRTADFVYVDDATALLKVDVSTYVNLKAFVVARTDSPASTKIPKAFLQNLIDSNVNLFSLDVDNQAAEFQPLLLLTVLRIIGVSSNNYSNLADDKLLKEAEGKLALLDLKKVEGEDVEVETTWSNPGFYLGSKVQELNSTLSNYHRLVFSNMFPEVFGVNKDSLFASGHGKNSTFHVKVTENIRITPVSYDRDVFHIEFDTASSGLTYNIGDALGVHGENDPVLVQNFLDWYGLNGEDIVAVKNEEHNAQSLQTVRQLLTCTLDMWGRPSKRFYAQLADFATDSKEAEALRLLTLPQGSEDYKKRVDDTLTHEDILMEFTSCKPSIEQLAELIPAIKPRHYSIASSQKVHPNSVHLLVVLVGWTDARNRVRYGQCTRYLRALKPGQDVVVSVKPSVMKLPPLTTQPVIMAGLGTGMAPFRAFIEERAWQAAQGHEIGPVVLYFGSRHRSQEYLYGEELDAYHQSGILSSLRLAFSRDQAKKVYIQHHIAEDKDMISDLLLKKDGCFYLCGPTWPAGDVRDAIMESFTSVGGLTVDEANELLDNMKEEGRYVLEVY